MRRRAFLQSSVATVLSAAAVCSSRAAGIAAKYEGLKSDRYLSGLKTLAKVTGPKIFTEGPCCDRAGNVFFTNTEASQILKWDGRQLTVFREDNHAANGLLFDRQGRLVACEGRSGRVTRTDLASGKVEVLAESFGGHGLGAPNDLCFDRQGRIYFTSRLPNTDPARGNVNAVYRIDPDGAAGAHKLSQVLKAPEIDMPNGIVTSPDDQLLYLVESDGRLNRKRCIMAYDLAADGTVSKPRKLIDFFPGRRGDGMAIDEQGNLYIAAGLHQLRNTTETLDTRPGIHVVTPAGELVAFVQTPEDTITNCRFGGADLKTLYIACGTLLLSLRTQIAGKPLYRPER